MNKTTIYLPADVQRRLQAEALRTDRRQAAIIREAVERYLDAQEQIPLRSVGMLTARSLTSANQERWLQERWGDERPVPKAPLPPAE